MKNPYVYATAFGYAGSYGDYVQEIAAERGGLYQLIKLDISENEVTSILRKSGFAGYRYDGALRWIVRTIGMIRSF